MEVKLIVFDKDGTLLDCDAYWQEAIRLQLKGLADRGVDEDTIKWCRVSMGINADGSLDPDGPWVLASSYDEKIVLATCLYQRLGWQWDRIQELLDEVYHELEELMCLETISKAIPGVPEALAALQERGYILAVATTDNHLKAEAMLETAGISHFFADVIGRDLVAKGKPAPDMLAMLAEKHGLMPQEVVMVGDGLPDVEMAKNFGAIPIGVLSGAGREQALREVTGHIFPQVQSFVHWLLTQK
jgi:phosphoglycolate phosphatase